MQQNLSYVLVALVVAGCASESESETSARVTGSSAYQDATTDHGGAATEPARPPAQTIELELVVEGTGQVPEVDPQCALDPAGAFEARYVGDAQLGADHAYVASLAAADATIATPSGCEVPDLTVGVITDVRVRAHLEATTQNCDTYCAASARAEAEQSCGATTSAAACRASAEAQAEAACTTTCTTEAHRITAEVSLGATAVGAVDAEALRAAAFGELSATLTFDRLTDAAGEPL